MGQRRLAAVILTGSFMPHKMFGTGKATRAVPTLVSVEAMERHECPAGWVQQTTSSHYVTGTRVSRSSVRETESPKVFCDLATKPDNHQGNIDRKSVV